MSQSAVILKSNPYGLVLNLNPDLPFEELQKAVGEKFRESADFFKNAKLALTFRGRPLTREEENRLVDEVVGNSRIQVVCIVDEEKQSAEFYRRAVEHAQEKQQEGEGYFYRGTLRSGQRLETETSVVVIGNVNPGAQIVSRGNIVVLGCCMGKLHAGAGGDRSCIAAALTMKPMEVRIADKTGRSAIVKKKDTGEYPLDPKIAYINKDGHLRCDPITSENLSKYLT